MSGWKQEMKRMNRTGGWECEGWELAIGTELFWRKKMVTIRCGASGFAFSLTA